MKVVIRGLWMGAVLLIASGAMLGSASAAAGLQVSPHKLNFQLQSGPPISQPQMVKISNSGPAITGLSIQVSGRASGDFQKDLSHSDCTTDLGAGASCMVALTFHDNQP